MKLLESHIRTKLLETLRDQWDNFPCTLILRGQVPSKKNTWKRSGNNGMYIPTEVRAALNGLILQARSQWNPRQPLDHAYVKARFLVKDGRQDLDNKLTCILDVLVEAGVLINDSIAHLAGFEASAVLVGRKMDERTEIDVWRDLGWKAIS